MRKLLLALLLADPELRMNDPTIHRLFSVLTMGSQKDEDAAKIVYATLKALSQNNQHLSKRCVDLAMQLPPKPIVRP